MTLYPEGYGTAELTFEQLKAKHAPKMHPEFARRLFAWIEVRGGFVGIGGGWRAVQPVKPGFAPPGKSFHESQTFASGLVAYAAVDLVVRQPGQKHRAPTWAETADARQFGLHAFVIGEPWHIQCVEMRGFQTWVNAGRPDPARIDLPGEIAPPPQEEPVRVNTVRMKGTLAVYDQWDNGTKTHVTEGAMRVKTALGFDPATVVELPNADWMQATGPIVGPIPAGVDAYGVPV